MVQNLVETPLEVSCDVYVHKECSKLGFNNALSNPLDQSHVSLMCSQPSFSLEHYFDVPINNPMIYDSNVDLDYEDTMLNVLGGYVVNFFS